MQYWQTGLQSLENHHEGIQTILHHFFELAKSLSRTCAIYLNCIAAFWLYLGFVTELGIKEIPMMCVCMSAMSATARCFHTLMGFDTQVK